MRWVARSITVSAGSPSIECSRIARKLSPKHLGDDQGVAGSKYERVFSTGAPAGPPFDSGFGFDEQLVNPRTYLVDSLARSLAI
jgi:hypothetical protein